MYKRHCCVLRTCWRDWVRCDRFVCAVCQRDEDEATPGADT